jgi:hypothetical protein
MRLDQEEPEKGGPKSKTHDVGKLKMYLSTLLCPILLRAFEQKLSFVGIDQSDI